MSREEYILQRTHGKFDYLYEFYKEAYNPKMGNFLEKESFLAFIGLWPGANQALQDVTQYYDHKFVIGKLIDLKTNNIIKFI